MNEVMRSEINIRGIRKQYEKSIRQKKTGKLRLTSGRCTDVTELFIEETEGERDLHKNESVN